MSVKPGGHVRQGFRFSSLSPAIAIAALLFGLAGASVAPASVPAQPTWISAWASAQILVDPQNAIPPNLLNDFTLRQLVRTTIAGSRLRIRVSNVFGTAPLTISGVNIARAVSPSSSRIDPSTDRSVTFSGARAVTIPPGAEYISDSVDFRTPELATLAISMHLIDAPRVQTGHPGSRATSYAVPGDHLSATELRQATTVDHWYTLTGVDVEPKVPSAAVAIVGDSIVDGHGVVSNTDTRWTDTLAERMKSSAATRSLAVLNLGIGSNCLAESCVGPSAVARFERDVLARSGVRYVIILEGVNDLGMLTRDAPASAGEHHALVQRSIEAYAQMAQRAREHGIKVIGATILPYGGSDYYHPDAANEADRAAINAWIRTPRNLDAVVDFDALMRDPAHPLRLRKELDSGDGLHPSALGYRFMGEAVPLSLFAASASQPRSRKVR